MPDPQKSDAPPEQVLQELRQRLAHAEAGKARAEAALRHIEARYRAFLDHSPCVAFLKNQHGQYVYGNVGLERLLSCTDQSFVGKNDYELFSADIATNLRINDAAVLSAGRTLETIEDVPDTQGALRSWLVMKFPVPDESGDLLLGGVAVDITERQQMEQSLRQGKERIRLALNAGKMVTWGWNIVENRLDEWNPEYRAMYGFSADDPATFENALARLHPDDRPHIVERIAQIVATPGDDEWREEFRILHPQRGERWLFGLGRCFRDDTGRPLQMMGVSYDITERKYAELELQRQNTTLTSILESMAEGVVVADETGQFIRSNRAAEQIAGVGQIQSRPDEYATRFGLYLTDGVTPMPDDQVPLAQAIRGKSVDAVDLYLKNKVVSEGKWLNVTARPLRDQDGSHRGGVVVFRDVTERRLSEEKLKEYTHQLQALSRRLLDIQEEERRHLARELHDEVGQALTGLKLMFERASLEKLAPSSDVYADAIRLVQDLMVRVRTLSMHLRPTLLDDFGLVTALRWHIRQYTEQTGVHVMLDVAGLEEGDRLPPELEIGGYRIAQEALTNVARHTQISEVAVQVRRENGVLLVRIEDKGPGFNPQGIWNSSGISGMRERATLLGGTLDVHSRPGDGTQISARLPVASQR